MGQIGGSPEVSVEEAKRRLDEGAILIDVRDPEEWRSGHAGGARHIPLGQLGSRIDEVPRDKEVLLICRSGGRSASAVRLLRNAGYEKAINVAGGTTAWAQRGLPVSR
ncbi:MAG: rhodanese-like domain-containing protein [Chloroflexota bacterium]